VSSSSITDPSFTYTNLTRLLYGVEEWTLFYLYYLDIPYSKHTAMKRRKAGLGEHKLAYCDWYLKYHPAPSWKHVADGLYLCGEHTTLNELSALYLEG
jgi:hypothetical protein